MSNLSDYSTWLVTGKDGELLLLASPDKTEGAIYSTLDRTTSTPKPLQVHYKWGVFEPVDPPVTLSAYLARGQRA